MLMSKNYLITGGAGFVGSHLTELLLNEGHTVVVFDNESTGNFNNLPEKHDNLHKYFGDVCNKTELNQVFSKFEFDKVFHLASAVGVKLIMEEPIGSMNTIIEGTRNVLDAVSKLDSKPEILITSTSEVYGKSLSIPFREDGEVIYGPTKNYRWCYAYAKALDEMMALGYHKEGLLKPCIVRLFNTVGPKQSSTYGMVLPRFVQSVLNEEDIVIHGTGTQTRCFCHVKDVVKALYSIVNSDNCVGQVVNIGGTEEISIKELACRVSDLAGTERRLIHKSYNSVYKEGFEDMQRRVPSIEKVYNLIGWKPTYSLNDIVNDVIQHERNVLKSKT